MDGYEDLAVASLPAFALARLERFARLADDAALAGVPLMGDLAARATLSAYRDCLALGLAAEAQSVLARSRRRSEQALAAMTTAGSAVEPR